MTTIKLDLPLPDDFEEDEGQQPRAPKEGEYYYNLRRQYVSCCTGNWGPGSGVAIILRKKAPVYKTTYISRNGSNTEYVEIKALEDLLPLIDDFPVTGKERHIINALKELLK
jgi:hypothetical protein